MTEHLERNNAPATGPKLSRFRTWRAIHANDSTVKTANPSITPSVNVAICPKGRRWCEVDVHRRIQRVVDPAAGEEGVDEPVTASGCSMNRLPVAEPGEYDLVAVRQVRQELVRCNLRWR